VERTYDCLSEPISVGAKRSVRSGAQKNVLGERIGTEPKKESIKITEMENSGPNQMEEDRRKI